MAENYMVLIFLLELAVFFIILYSLIKADNWVKEQCSLVESQGPTLVEALGALKDEFKRFNSKFKNFKKSKQIDLTELSNFTGEIITDLAKAFIPGFGFKRKLIPFKVFFKVFKNMGKIKAAFIK